METVFSIEKIYVKDLSLEVPNAPKIFLEREQPKIDVQLQTRSNALDDNLHEVLLTITITARIQDKTMFLVEAVQAGVFQMRNANPQELELILAIGCPNILFPYARETVSDLVTRAGFPPVILNPVNFENLYRERQQQTQPQTSH
ncbi:MAG: protein-export chaperone SecB [Burkholderiales bacterium]|nr:protein-export chaperone SecB [Burkholderiales bacterium]